MQAKNTPKIKLWNLVRAEIKLAFSPLKISYFLFSFTLAILTVAFSKSTSNEVFLQQINSALLMFITISIFAIVFDLLAADRFRLVFLLFPKKKVTFTRLAVEVVFLLFKLFLLIAIFLLSRIASDDFKFQASIIVPGLLKSLIPACTLYVCAYVIANYCQTFSKNANLSRTFLTLGIYGSMLPVLLISFFLTGNKDLFDWLEKNAIWIQCIPYINFTSILFSTTSAWWGSLIYLAEVIIFFGFMWEKYSYHLKTFIIKSAD